MNYNLNDYKHIDLRRYKTGDNERNDIIVHHVIIRPFIRRPYKDSKIQKTKYLKYTLNKSQ